MDDVGVATFFAGLPDGPPCQHVMAASGLVTRDKSRHDAYNDAALGVLSAGRGGCPGAVATLKRLKSMFVAEIADRSSKAEAEGEWRRNLLGAVALIIGEKPEQGQGCPDDYVAELLLAETSDTAQDAPEADEQAQDARTLAVARKAAELALVEDARTLLATWRAGQAPPLGGHSLSAFLAQPDEAVAYRIDRLWPINGRVLLAAAAKAGKTTMVMNLLKALADGGTFLGCYDVEQVTGGTIVYLNMEVSPNQMRRWMRRAGIVNTDRIVVENLRGRVSALTLASPQGRQRVAEWLAGLDAEVVILDPLAPLLGSLGLEEKENSDIARFFSWWSEMLHDAGVREDFICHHAGWDGTRSRGASRLVDEPDAVWTIDRDKATDEDGDDIYDNNEPRFLKAIGRDVDLPESLLKFQPATGGLELAEGNRKVIRAASKIAKAEVRVLAAVDAGNRSKRSIVKAGGNEKDNEAALEGLVSRGVLRREIVGSTHIHSRGVAVSPSVSGDGATVSVASLYIGDTDMSRAETVHPCEDCGDDTGNAGFKICAGCEQKRRGT